ncbi:MAG: alpha/beta fold hydrolase, partial [Gemmatimonadaceae bacterium]
MRGEFLDLQGTRLYYYAAGNRGAGEPVLFLHGFATSSRLWSDVVPLMPSGHRIVVLDQLGYGRSDRPLGRPVDILAHATRVVQVLDELRIERACIVGHGIGGGIAQSVAVRHPDRVSRLGLVDTVAFDVWPTLAARMARASLLLTRFLPPDVILGVLRRTLCRGYSDAVRATHSLDLY